MGNKCTEKLILVFFIVTFSFFALFFLNKKFNIGKQKSVILITIDTLRPDHLGCYGYKRDTSPNIDTLAKKGVLFTQAISADTWTVPSMSSILTSLSQPMHGVLYYGDELISKSAALTEVLNLSGYNTAFIGPQVISTIRGFERGFNFFDTKLENEQADYLTDNAISWIKEHQAERLFLWLHYFDPHAPYNPPLPYKEMFLNNPADNEKEELRVLSTSLGFGGIPSHAYHEEETDLFYYISQYDGEIRFVDYNIGRLLDFLRKLGIDKHTLIIITADHGEYLGEHKIYFTHGGIPLEPVVKVPLIIYDNGGVFKKSKVNYQVSLIDIAPTILNFLKIAKPDTMTGQSLTGLIRGLNTYPNLFSYTGSEVRSAVRTSEWKLIHINYEKLAQAVLSLSSNEIERRQYLPLQMQHLFGGYPSYILFNLQDNSAELVNIIDKKKEQFEFLKEKLDIWEESYTPTERFKNVTDGSNIKELDKENVEHLKSLGYLQ